MEERQREQELMSEDFGGEDDYELDRPSRRIARLIFIVGALIVVFFVIHYMVVEVGGA